MHQVHSMIYKEYNRIDATIHKIIIELLFNQAHSVIVVSEGIKKDLIENFNTNSDKIKVIYNPIDIKKVDAAATESGNEKIFENYHLPIIINVGRLTNQKGQWHLIRILPMILSQVPCTLIIRGTGELKLKLEQLINDLNLNTNVEIIPWLENPFRYISRFLCFCIIFSLLGSLMCYWNQWHVVVR